MPLASQHRNYDPAKKASEPSRQQQAQQHRQSPAMLLRRRLGGQRVAPQTIGVDPSPRQHVAISHFGQQHHSSRPSAWVIPFQDDDDEIVKTTSAPPIAAVLSSEGSETPPLLSDDDEEEEGYPIVTPDRPTPCTSNTRKVKTVRGLARNRGLHNSHRKTKLHYITPRRAYTPQLDQVQPNSSEQQHQQQQQRGNGVVLDLTSLFSGDVRGRPISPADSQQQQQHLLQAKSPPPLHYNAPTPPPWRSTGRTMAASSPITVVSDHSTNQNNNDNASTVNVLHHREDLQWDTKSQTTQEALLTERQCQALTQWLNFVLVGEQQSLLQQEESLKKATAARRTKASFDEDDARSRATTPSISRATTPKPRATTPTPGRSTTPLSRGGRSITPIPTGRMTPTAASRAAAPTGRAATPTPSEWTHPAANNNNKRQRHRRLSLFQYGESYEHAQDQAHHWFQHSAQWKELRRRIRQEIASGKLSLREDRNLYANVGCRDILLELFCSYKPAWLTMALEVVMNDAIVPLQGHVLPSQKQLKHFIVHRVLMDAKLLSKYTQGRGSGTPSGKFEQQFQAELQPLVLYRILILIFFLDRAAVKFQAQNNKGASCSSSMGNLFLAKSKVKSTAQVLVMICREFLGRQGDIVKQLARVNLHVYYKQGRLDEIEYPIVNFAIDLRDGVRLCRVLEVLWLLPRRQGNGQLLNNNRPNNGGGIDNAIKYPLLHQLRIPAISRLQKIHNVNVALTALQEQCQIGLPSDLQAHHIVDGQRRMVMRLVWTIVLMHCFENADLLTREQVEEEIAQAQALQRHHHIIRERRRLAQLDQQSSLNILERESDAVESVALVSNDETGRMNNRGGAATNHHPQNNLPPVLSLTQSRSSSFEDDEESNASLSHAPVIQQWKSVLFQWCQQVCMLVDEQEKESRSVAAAGGRPPKNTSPDQWTTTDLANGKALCCLIHHYHPSILPLDDLRLASRVVDGPPIRIQTNSSVSLTGRFRHMRHQRRSPKIAPDYYMRLAQRRLTEIGGIPNMMLLPVDKNAKGHQRKKPSVVALGEEKSILVFLYHVCARLIESRHQVQAVVFVQQRYRYLRMVTLWRLKLQAAKTILDAWRENRLNYYENQERKYKWAVDIIEAFMSRNFAKLLLLQEKRLSRELENLAITPIQALARRFLSNIHLHSMLERQAAAIKIQARFRQFHEYHTYQILLLEIQPAATVVQRHWKGFVQRRAYAAIIDATIRVQCFLRGAVVIQRIQLWQDSATCIQRIWRGFWAQIHYQMDLLDINAIQCLVRKQQAILKATTRSHAVRVLQRNARIFLARESLRRQHQERLAAIAIQKTFRAFMALLEASRLRAELALLRATLVVQRSWRRTMFLRERENAALTIQTHFRMWAAVRNYSRVRSALKIQTHLRMWAAVRNYSRVRSALKIQTHFRMWAAVRSYSRLRNAIKIQAYVRRFVAYSDYCAKRVSSLTIQTQWRRYAQRSKFCDLIERVIRIQCCARRWKAVREANSRKAALEIVQKYGRRWLAVRRLKALKKRRDDTIRFAVVCQALVRRNLCSFAWKKTKRSIRTIQAKWRRYWFLKIFQRKQELLSALSTCDMAFRHLQKGSFKIVPFSRQLVQLSKQAIARCGKKRIVLSNASTWVVPWHGHRQKLFRHRSHVKTVRVKYNTGVQLQELPRQLVTLGMLRVINEAAKRLQAPWTYAYLQRCVTGKEAHTSSKKTFSQHRATKRAHYAKKLLAASIKSLVKRSVDGHDATLATTYKRDMRRITVAEPTIDRRLRSPTIRLQHDVNTTRALNLVHRNTNLSLAKRSSVELFEDPFKKKIQMNAKARIVQKHWRRYAAQKGLREELRNVVISQSIARGFLVKQLYKATIKTVGLMQATVRGFLVRQRLKKRHKAARILQSCWRGASARSTYSTLVRRHRRLVTESTASSKIQAVARGTMVRLELVMLHTCAAIVQRRARGIIARERVKPLKDALRNGKSAAIIQHAWNGHRQRVSFKNDMKSVVTAQTAVRRWSARKQMQQKVLEELNKAMVESAAKLQATARAFLCSNRYLCTRKAIITMQSTWRMQTQKMKLARLGALATRIQSSWRSFNCRSNFMYTILCVIKIQAAARVCLAKRRPERERELICRQQLAVGFLQRCVRGFLARQKLSLENFAANEIQRIWRGYDDASGYIYVVCSCIKIQSFLRMAKAKKVKQGLLLEQLQDTLHQYHKSATRLQSLCRRMSAQKLASDAMLAKKRRHDSAVKVQSMWRRRKAREYAAKLARVVREEERQRSLVEEKQRKSDLHEQQRQLAAVLRLQCAARMVLAKKLEAELSKGRGLPSPPKVDRAAVKTKPEPLKLSLAHENSSVPSTPKETVPPKSPAKPKETPKAASRLRSPKSAKPMTPRRTTKQKISDLSPRSDAQFHRRLSQTQGVVRGFLARRQSNPAVQKVQVLIKEAELRARLHPSMRLGARMEKALQTLKTSRSLTEIMNVVCTIELATRFSKECCAEFVLAGATQILVSLLYDLNKSLPHVELLYYLMRTLLNICKYGSMVDDIATVETAKAFLHLIRMYGSEDAVFCSAVSLLEVCASRNEEVRALIATPQSRRRMEGICKQWERKLNRRLAVESPSSGMSTPQRRQREAPSQNVYTPQFMSKRNKAKTDMLILGISYDLQSGVTTFRQVLSRTI